MESTRTYRTLLIATDDSPEAHYASMRGLELARDLGAKVLALYVVDTPAARTLDIVSLSLFSKDIQTEVSAHSKDAVEYIARQAQQMGVEVEGLVAEGSPGQMICKAASEQQADLIVMGATGKTSLEEILMGSVSQHVIRHSQQPVLVVRGRA